MANAWMTSTTLVESVKQRAMIPIAQNTFSTDMLLQFANEELKIGMLPSILTFHEEFFLFPQDVAITAGITKYEIPYRAVGGKIRDLAFKDTNDTLYEMARVNTGDRVFYQQNRATSNQYYNYTLENNYIVLPESEGASGNLSMLYYLRPNDLVKSERIATITAIAASGSNTILTFNQIPDNIRADITNTTTQSNIIDFLQTKPPHKTFAFDYTLPAGSLNVTSKQLTLPTADLPLDELDNVLLNVGDYVAQSGECFIPQIPTDLHVMVAQRVAIRCLEALGDTSGLTNAMAKLAEMNSLMGNLVDNRSESSPIKIVNWHSPLRISKLASSRWGN